MTDDIRRLQLELGGRYFELIEFSLTRRLRGRLIKGIYGVNVAKVREVVRMPKVNALSARIRGIAGIFELRGIPIPAISLSVALGDDEIEPQPNQQIIVTEFSQKRAGFVVDATHRIRRVAWDKVMPPSADVGSCINGMTLIDNNEFLFILDLERILATLEHLALGGDGAAAGPVIAPAFAAPDVIPGTTGTGARILLVDDSQFIRNGVKQAMLKAGFLVVEAGDGMEALLQLDRSLQNPAGRIDLMVTDVEMPRMDGLSLTKKVRDNPKLAGLPIVLHTSLSGKSNQSAGMNVGANAYVVKNDLRTLFEVARELLNNAVHARTA